MNERMQKKEITNSKQIVKPKNEVEIYKPIIVFYSMSSGGKREESW